MSPFPFVMPLWSTDADALNAALSLSLSLPLFVFWLVFTLPGSGSGFKLLVTQTPYILMPSRYGGCVSDCIHYNSGPGSLCVIRCAGYLRIVQ